MDPAAEKASVQSLPVQGFGVWHGVRRDVLQGSLDQGEWLGGCSVVINAELLYTVLRSCRFRSGCLDSFCTSFRVSEMASG